MRFLGALVSLALVANAAGSSWFSKAAYNKWHETELERWLSDHDIPYPTPADRRDLEKLVQSSWDSYVVHPYQSWDSADLTAYLKQKGIETKDSAAANKDYLVTQVGNSWYEGEDKAQQAWGNVKDWILDTWTESQLKAFCDHNGVPVPQPRKRDTILQKARSSYDAVAQKLGDTAAAAYPGDWLYETWTDSDLKEWLDTNGFPAPQITTRDKLIASVRRNSRLAYLRSQDQLATASASASAAYATLTDKLIDAWGESQLKDFCDRNGINVPQGTKVNQLRALIRKHRAEFLSDTLSASAASKFGAATSNVGEHYAKATDAASKRAQQAFDEAVDTWSESRLKGFLDARGVPVPQGSRTNELRALVRKHAHKAATNWNAWTFDDFSYDNLKQYLESSGNAAAKKASKKAGATREDLAKAAQSAYASASSAGGQAYASATNYLVQATASAKQATFDTWSESELKSYLDTYGIPAHQGSTQNELRAQARKHYTYFKYGTTNPTDTILAKLGESLKDGYQWVMSMISSGSEKAKEEAKERGEKLRQEL